MRPTSLQDPIDTAECVLTAPNKSLLQSSRRCAVNLPPPNSRRDLSSRVFSLELRIEAHLIRTIHVPVLYLTL